MKTINLIVLMLISVLFFQCEKENKTNITEITTASSEAISGHIYMDTNNDNIGDTPLANVTVLWDDSIVLSDLLYDENATNLDWENIISTKSNSEGYYSFEGLTPSSGKALMLRDQDPQFGLRIYNIHGKDITIDGDYGELNNENYLPVQLTEDELDDGNNFIVNLDQTSISGYVFSDPDNDPTTNDVIPYTNGILKLYNDLPFETEAIDSSLIDEDGKYEFINHTAGLRFRIELTIHPSLYIWEHRDVTPDPDGGEEHDNQYAILVELGDNESDEDNNYLISKVDNSCTDDPYIEPYWAFCETNDVCDQEEWPIIVRKGDGSHITLIDGYIFNWINHTTGTTSSSDAMYAHESDSITLDIYTTDSCIYHIAYQHVCPNQQLEGDWYLRKLVENPWMPDTINYYAKEVTWSFNVVDETVTILSQTGIDLEYPEDGTYPYYFDEEDVLFIDGSRFADNVMVNNANDQLVISDVSVDGPIFEFVR